MINCYGFVSRDDAQLTYPEPGTAYLAIQSQAPILPVALLGTEKILPNLFRCRRTDVVVRIGEPFGPLTVAAKLAGTDRRQRLQRVAEGIMHLQQRSSTIRVTSSPLAPHGGTKHGALPCQTRPTGQSIRLGPARSRGL